MITYNGLVHIFKFKNLTVFKNGTVVYVIIVLLLNVLVNIILFYWYRNSLGTVFLLKGALT